MMKIRGFGFWVLSFSAKSISVFIFLLFSQSVFGQHTISLSEDVSWKLDYYFNNSNTHAAIKPALDVDVNGKTYKILDSSVYVASDNYKSKHDFYSEYALNYPRLSFRNYYAGKQKGPQIDPNRIPVQRKAAFLIRPIYDLNFGNDFNGKHAIYSTVGGAIIDFDYKQKIGLEIRLASGTTSLPNYSDSITFKSHVIPGWGDRAYLNSNGTYSFQHISGNLIWRPSKIFNLQVGRDKHFWGDGYRSLFLSDLSAAAPYIKQSTTIWKLQYTSLFMWLQDNTHSKGIAADFRSKFATFHYISFNATKWLNVGIFESVIWQGTDPSRQRGFDPNYLNPIVFFRPVEYSLGSSDNALLGMALKFRLNKNNLIYSQLLLDEFYLKEILARKGWWANKQAYQIGFKCFNFAHVKNLFFQTEMNIVRPFTYAHGSKQQNYSNAGMPLAHPMGANFMEVLGIVSYSHKELIVTGKFIVARYGLDPAGKNYGQNINRSYISRDHEYENYLFQGVATNLIYTEIKAAYKLNLSFPVRFELLAGLRSENNVLVKKKGSYIQLGLSLPLWRTYRDY